MKIKVSRITDIGCILFFIYAFFSDLINVVIGSTLRLYMFWALILVICFLPLFYNKSLKLKKTDILLIAIIVFFVCFRNQAYIHGDLLNTNRWLVGFILFMGISKSKYPIKRMIPMIANIGFVHTIVTWILFFKPSIFSTVYNLWGYWPTGTEGGKLGYRAGLTNHYSHNGIVLAVTLIAIFSLIFMYSKLSKSISNKRKIRKYIVMFLLTIGAIILTTKRAHFLFAIMAMIIVYYFAYPERMGNKTFKLLLAIVIGGFVLFISSKYIPALANLFERFRAVRNGDSNMQSRYVLWALALSMFFESPLLGKGWYSFRYEYNAILYSDAVRAGVRSARYDLMDVHNVYIQLLAETGLIGLIIYLIIVSKSISSLLKLLKTNTRVLIDYSDTAAIVFSLTMQFFVLLYCFTGNCLYDITSPFYLASFFICSSLLNR